MYPKYDFICLLKKLNVFLKRENIAPNSEFIDQIWNLYVLKIYFYYKYMKICKKTLDSEFESKIVM